MKPRRNGITLEFKRNFEIDFQRLPVRPVMINDFDLTLEEDRERFQAIMSTRYNGDVMSPIATCLCGAVHNQTKMGIRCGDCGTICQIPVDKETDVSVWMEAPRDLKFLHPMLLMMLMDCTGIAPRFETMKWLLDPHFIPKVKTSDAIDKFLALGIPRGVKNFVDNFDEIIETLRVNRIFKTRRVADIHDVIPLIAKYRDSMLTKYLPLPDSRLLVVEAKDSSQSEADVSLLPVLDAAGFIASTSGELGARLTQQQLDSRVAKAMFLLADHYKDFLYKHVRAPTAWPRKHIYGTSLGYTSRLVITSLRGQHHHQELEYPWGAFVALMEEDFSGMLRRRGYMPNQITEILSTAAIKWCPIVDELVNETLANSPCIPGTNIRGRPVTFQRPPSLYRGSTQLLYITRVLRDPAISSAAMSDGVLRAPNADFDGDNMQLTLIRDKMQLEYFSRLEPHLYSLDISNYRRVSGNLRFQGPIMSTLGNWLQHVEEA